MRAVASGKLLRIEHGGPGGLEVLIQHESFVSVYSHLASVAPSLGKSVIAAGDEVGVVGHTGVSYGPHLFFALLGRQSGGPSTVSRCAIVRRDNRASTHCR